MAEKKTASTARVASFADVGVAAYNSALQDTERMGMTRATLDNYSTINSELKNSTSHMNAIFPSIIDKIVTLQMIKPKYKGTLGLFVRELQAYGNPVEELIQQPGIEHDFDTDLAPARETSREGLPDIRAAYHHVNRNKQYPLYLDIDQMQMAVSDWESFGKYMVDLVDTHIMWARNRSRQLFFTQLLTSSIKNGAGMQVLTSPLEDNPTATRKFVKQVKSFASQMAIGAQRWNEAGVQNVNENDTLYLIVTPAVQAEMEVEVQSMAFNLELVNTNVEIKLIEEFISPEGLPMPHVQAMLIDKRFINYYPKFDGTGQNQLAASRAIKVFGNDEGRGYYSPFRNSVTWATQFETSPTGGSLEGKTVNYGLPGGITSESRPTASFVFGYEMFKGQSYNPTIADLSPTVQVTGDATYFNTETVNNNDGTFTLNVTRNPGVPGSSRVGVTVALGGFEGGLALAPFTVQIQEGF